MSVIVLVKKLHPDAVLPSYQTPYSAGLDLTFAPESGESLVLAPLSRALLPTGLAVAIPGGYEGQVRPRSGWALKHGITVLNSPGTIDADYRGEVKVLLINLGPEAVTIKRGDRIAQMVVTPVERADIREVGMLPKTGREAGGFGSTGR